MKSNSWFQNENEILFSMFKSLVPPVANNAGNLIGGVATDVINGRSARRSVENRWKVES